MAQSRCRRRRRRLNPRFVILVAVLALLLVVLIRGIASCSKADPTPTNEPAVTTTDPVPQFGWMREDGKLYYVNQDGSRPSGWFELDGKRYLLDEEGFVKPGWFQEGENTYYIKEDGAMATGTIQVDGVTYHFTSAGVPILLVNPWNPVPEGYAPDLVELSMDVSVEGSKVDRSCYDALMEMINACNRTAPRVCVVSSYRTQEYQTNSYNRKVQSYLDKGMPQEQAEKEAATIIAKPGTSEHQLGLAVDIIDTRLWALEEQQENLPAQKWLMEHAWEYGFVLRYPKGKIDQTGIIYEPWHYRYVGKAVAQELHESGLTLEEYLQSLS